MQCYLNYHGKWCSALFVECQAVNFQWGCSWCQVFARCKIFASEIPNSHFHTSSNQSCITMLLFTLLLVLTVKSVKKITNHDILTKRYQIRCTEQILSQLEVQAMQVGIITIIIIFFTIIIIIIIIIIIFTIIIIIIIIKFIIIIKIITTLTSVVTNIIIVEHFFAASHKETE